MKDAKESGLLLDGASSNKKGTTSSTGGGNNANKTEFDISPSDKETVKEYKKKPADIDAEAHS